MSLRARVLTVFAALSWMSACSSVADTPDASSAPGIDASAPGIDASAPGIDASTRADGAIAIHPDAGPAADAATGLADVGPIVLQPDHQIMLLPREADGTMRGTYTATQGIGVVEFWVRATGPTSAEASYSTMVGMEMLTVGVVLSDRAVASLNMRLNNNSSTRTGYGPPDPRQFDLLPLLTSFGAISYAMRDLPLELGCSGGFYASELAALLFPYQMMLKYNMLDRVEDFRQTLAYVDCEYVHDDHAPPMTLKPPRQGLILAGHEDFFPNVLGFFAFDDVGAYEAPHADSPTGTCEGKCRGSCGIDCNPDNCHQLSHDTCLGMPSCTKARTTEYDCGLHEGCVEHDGCYDRCQELGCDSWAALACMHDPLDGDSCDLKCFAEFGIAQCVEWAGGHGPFTSRQMFSYTTTVEYGDCCLQHPECCGTCLAGGSLVTLADGTQVPIESLHVHDRIAAIDTDTGEPGTAEIELVLVHEDGPFFLDRLLMSSGETLDVTANHPIWTVERGYAEVSTLSVGEHMLHLDPETQEVEEVTLVAIIREVSATDVVYNLKTTAHSYIAADILVHNKCVARGSLIDTPTGARAIESLAPGDVVYGMAGGVRVPTRVTRVFTKSTILGHLPGKRLAPDLAVTINHPIAVGDGYRAAGELPAQAEEVVGDVYDLATESGNYVSEGVTLEAAR